MSTTSYALPNNCYALKATNIQHYTDRLFHFTTTRDPSFRFRSGEFVMVALPSNKPIWRAYSVASPAWHDELEFYSIKVEDGPLTSKLRNIARGDILWMRKKATGTLVLDALLPGRNLYLFSTGTGFAPFASIIRDLDTYERFDNVIVTHTARQSDELIYSRTMIEHLRNDDILRDIIGNKLHYYPTTTREETKNNGRIIPLLTNQKLYHDLQLPILDHTKDRGMICGSMAMLHDVKHYLIEQGFNEGSNANPGDFVIEKAFVD